MSASLHVDLAASSDTSNPSAAPMAQAQAAARVKVNRKVIQVNAVRNTTGRPQAFVVSNSGTSSFTLGTDAFSFTGPDASQFAITGGSLPRKLNPGKKAQFFVALKPGASADVNRVLTATLQIKLSGASSPIGSIALRGLATTGEGGDKEPSLARLMELFQYSINVGDSSPETTFLNVPTGAATDEQFAPRFARAGNGPITLTPVAQFVSKTATYAGRFGYYEPGTPDSRRTLVSLNGADGQSVNPSVNGVTTFDTGGPFSVWAEAPTFIDNNEPRIIYGEDALNTWESNASARRKVRVYQLEEKKQLVPNAYVVTFEEYPPENDQNDYVFILRNVVALNSQPEIGLINVGGQPNPNRLAFNRIQNENTTLGNDVADTATVRIVNTGNKDLVISSIALNSAASGKFQILNNPGTLTLRRNATFDLNVKFVATGGDLNTGSLVITSNDKDEKTKSVALSGFWQSHSEADPSDVSQEPSLQEIFDSFGFQMTAVNDDQEIGNKGKREAVGDEILLDSLVQADESKPVYVEQIAGFHAQGSTNEFAWYETAKPFFYSNNPNYPGAGANGQQNALFSMNVNDGQSFFQRKNFSSDRAAASFDPDGEAFGFRIDNEYSEDKYNAQQPGDLGGHHFRFYPLRDASGNWVADTYLMTMDFSSINFDYNDNIYLVHNVRASNRPAAVDALEGVGSAAGISLDWADVAGAEGYLVQRSSKSNSGFATITSTLLSGSEFFDSSPRSDRSWYYRVIAVGSNDLRGMPDSVRVYRPRA